MDNDLEEPHHQPSKIDLSLEDEEEEDTEIYRKISLERKRHPDQLDTLLAIVNPASWLTLGALFTILATILIWSFVGSLPIIVQGNGIFMSEGGEVTVQTTVDGIVQRLHVKAGDQVTKGTLLAEIFDSKEELMYKTAEIKVTYLSKNLEELKLDVEKETAATKSGIEKDIAAKEFTIKENELNKKSLEEDLQKKKNLYAEGLISANTLRDAEAKLIQQNIDIENTKATIAGLKANLLKGSREGEIKAKEQELLKEIENRDLLKTSLEASKIYSPINGKIQEIFINQGDHVTLGQALIWLEALPSETNPLVVYAYFPVSQSKEIKVGQEAEVIIRKDRKILGKVKEVSEYPVSSESIFRLFHSKALEEYLTSSKNASTFTLIEVMHDTKGQLINYHSRQSADFEVSTGTVCEVHAIIDKVRPIYYLLPVEQFKDSQLKEEK